MPFGRSYTQCAHKDRLTVAKFDQLIFIAHQREILSLGLILSATNDRSV